MFRGVLPLSGTFDIPHYRQVLKNGARPGLAEEHVDAVFGADSLIQVSASPTRYLNYLSAPVFILCDNDLYAYTRHFEEAIRATPFRKMDVVYVYALGHGALWRNLAEPHSRYRAMMVKFIEENAG
jgi:hypothetical protein